MEFTQTLLNMLCMALCCGRPCATDSKQRGAATMHLKPPLPPPQATSRAAVCCGGAAAARAARARRRRVQRRCARCVRVGGVRTVDEAEVPRLGRGEFDVLAEGKAHVEPLKKSARARVVREACHGRPVVKDNPRLRRGALSSTARAEGREGMLPVRLFGVQNGKRSR